MEEGPHVRERSASRSGKRQDVALPWSRPHRLDAQRGLLITAATGNQRVRSVLPCGEAGDPFSPGTPPSAGATVRISPCPPRPARSQGPGRKQAAPAPGLDSLGFRSVTHRRVRRSDLL